MNKEEEKESDLIRSLREQVHKSFMQISEMEKLFHLEMEHTKEEFEEREKEIKKREQEIREKYQQIENNIKLKECFLVDVGELDVSLDQIAYRREDTLKDSGIDKIKELLAAERIMNDPQAQIIRLKELQTLITNGISNPPSALFQLFKISNELCLDNCRLRQELLNSQQTSDVYKAQILENERTIEKLKRGQRNLQKNNQQLNDLYVQQASQNAILEDEIRLVRDQVIHKKSEVENLKQQITKLSDLLKSMNKIDTSKLNFKLPTTTRDDEHQRPPAFLRMSSNAILLRPPQKASTPSPQISYETESSFPSAQFSQKYFKKKIDKIDGKKCQ